MKAGALEMEKGQEEELQGSPGKNIRFSVLQLSDGKGEAKGKKGQTWEDLRCREES